MSFEFEVIGADTENYFLMGFDEERDMSKGVFFYKIPLSFFDDFVFSGDDVIDILIDVELYIEEMYESLIGGGFLSVISYEEFLDIKVNFDE